jgi:hypothetical protein
MPMMPIEYQQQHLHLTPRPTATIRGPLSVASSIGKARSLSRSWATRQGGPYCALPMPTARLAPRIYDRLGHPLHPPSGFANLILTMHPPSAARARAHVHLTHLALALHTGRAIPCTQ